MQFNVARYKDSRSRVLASKTQNIKNKMLQIIAKAIAKARSTLRNPFAGPVSRMAYTTLDPPKELTLFRERTVGKYNELTLIRCW
jgi:hypothetical protein